MMATLLRLLVYSAAIYGFFLVSCPDWQGQGYHAVSLGLIAAAAIGLALFLRAVELGSKLFRLGVELAFAAGVFVYLGFTLPRQAGGAPLREWLEGRTPTRAHARDGLRRAGLDPDAEPAASLVRLFPKS